MAIDKINIPRTELSLFPMGYGTVDIGLKKKDPADIYPVLEAYLDMGGNVIDTARIYSDWVPPEIGRSERILGEWIRSRGRHDDFILITKGGHPRLGDMHTPRMSPKDMQGDIELSLKALGVDCIDIYFYHRDDISVPVGAHLEFMEEQRRKGNIRYYGCSNWTSERMDEAEEYAAEHGLRGFVANQMLFNIGQQHMRPPDDDTMVAMDEHMLKIHRRGNNLAMPYFGLCSGFFHKLDALGPDAVADSPYCTPGNLLLKKRIDAIRRETGASLTQVLLGFFYAQDFPVVPLVFSSNIDHLKDAMAAPGLKLDPSLYQAGGGAA